MIMNDISTPQTEELPKTPRRRGRPKLRTDEQILAIIINAAFGRVLKNGYGGTHMDDIALDCGISKRTLYRLVPSKQELFAILVTEHGKLMIDVPDDLPTEPPAEMLYRIFRTDLSPEEERMRVGFLDICMSDVRQFPELGTIIKRQGAMRSKAALTAWFERCHQAGTLNLPDRDRAAKMLMDMVFGAASFKTGQGTEWPGDENRSAYMRACIDVFVRGH
ncbi:TetR/AcrR family transcriptional regulator [Rhizobium alvei]|uniref:TetR/AcrR family transcriptional regulator n=1 Tax=Rhizobium alvei TaxID=1132659 RepID=A0ABT8YHF5_9HYPH|nr:TetR/AcrR family transcriptional regulator [Rhizobium alvei]MDO6963110.1 TetR/AcrR family transcriptional regulator [Rhizobium alvei]